MPAQNQKPAVTDKLKLMTTSRMKMPRVSFFMLLPPCRGGYGSVGNVGVMALPVWHEEAVLDPELLPLSYADSIPSASSRLASIALRAVSLSSASLSGVGGRDGFLSFESSAILSSEK